MEDALKWLALLRDAGITGILLIVIFGLMSGNLVPRWVYDKRDKEADEWKQLWLTKVDHSNPSHRR